MSHKNSKYRRRSNYITYNSGCPNWAIVPISIMIIFVILSCFVLLWVGS